MATENFQYRAWLTAENEAQDAESEVSEAMFHAATGRAAPPSAEMVLIAQTKRAKAHSLLHDAMQELAATSKVPSAIVTRGLARTAPTIEELSRQSQAAQGRFKGA
jgi:hypothetical protein